MKLVGEDIGRLGFNKAVARIYELVNNLQSPLAALSIRHGRARYGAGAA